ncbi:hypothetical protein [Amycolatopsis australiensis]|uniref:Uncharacterized protein n=1 Tax=Amycolatopsis australiensis TaxID=546364 RepID=A0A1K1SMQ5_9PSEU|nr:hypothetical protein [Amycolatopsis australiensis]SFW85492.1 hypothetical protein SAMN04489730_6151 [Amycolatopsis australiensis]
MAPEPLRRLLALAVGCVALAGVTCLAAADRHAPVSAGRAHGIAIEGHLATTADVRSDVRHG